MDFLLYRVLGMPLLNRASQGATVVSLLYVAWTSGAVTATGRLVCNAGAFDNGGRCELCPGGTFGARPGLTTPQCSGKCSGGFFCPPGSTSARHRPCGAEGVSIYYCPPGSEARRRVDDGFYTTILTSDGVLESNLAEQKRCEPGHYCVFGIRRPCPAGTYGVWPELTTVTCSGLCPKGSYCPTATVEPVACPAGSFGGEVGLSTATCSGPCPVGHYCEKGSITPKPCPPGTFGGLPGLTTRACSLNCSDLTQSGAIQSRVCLPSPCPAGYYCLAGAPTPTPCGNAGVFCPIGSSQPTTASSGYYTTWTLVSGDSRSSAAFTSTTAEVQLLLPLADQYIEGNTTAAQRTDTRTGQQPCEPGSYCVGGVKRLCPPGVYGATKALSSAACTAPCPAGYYCPEGTADYKRYPCTAKDSFCRIGFDRPSPVDPGYFTVTVSNSNVNNALFHLRVDQAICPLGSFCTGGVAHLCPPGTFGATTGLQTRACSGRCQAGYTCPLGSVSATQSPCPAGSYALPNGFSCAPCSPGFWCGAASPSPDQHACGSDAAFCPLGSALPTSVTDGFFATGQQTLTHTSQQRCSPRNAAHIPQCPSRTVGSLAGV